jgi:hypothetical protein
MKKAMFILLSILALSCNHEETNNLTDKTALNLVTGVNFRQSFDDVPFQLGNPNVLINNKFVIYPNPAIETFMIIGEENVTDVWIVPASPEKIYQDEDFSSVLNTNLYTEQSIVTHSDLSLHGQTSNILSVDITTLEKGYYRVFVKSGGAIYWDNLYKLGNEGNNEGQIDAFIDFWN